jgi:hypothetical protein
MRKQNFSISLLVTAWLAPFTLPAQPTTTSVTIRVSEPTGAGIAHAQIRLVPSPDKAPAKLETDGQGRLFINLKAGGYALFVSVPGFKRAAQHIDIGSTDGQIVPVVLQIGDVSSPTPIYAYPPESLLLAADPYHAPVALSPADFRALPHVTITVHNTHTNATETYSGVPLSTLLAMINAPIGKEFREEALTSYLIASGSDGYSVLLSLAEVDPSFHAGQVLVADTRDGQPLAKSGPLELIVSDDKRPTRWVRSLESITLQHAR